MTKKEQKKLIKKAQKADATKHIIYTRLARLTKDVYKQEIIEDIPEVKTVIDEEAQHEEKLLVLLDEDRLQYVGSVVLGWKDALVELTGAISGFTSMTL
jgi:VIT1/CCC1 family predicted Fe2+/Mn2+ transporter